jgi:type I restriction enzyme, S subunit
MGKYNAYEKYKDSGIEWLGEIPEHWQSLNFKRLTLIKRGASPRPIDDPKYFDDDGEYAWVRIADVTASERYLETTTQKLSELGKSLSVPLEPGNLFLSIAGSVGKPIITKIKCCIHDGFVYFPDLKANQEFIYYIFNSGQPYLGLGKMGTQLNLNTETVGGITIGLPPLPEQQAIANFLDYKTKQIDDLIAKKETLLEKLDEKRTAIISHAVTKGLDPNVPMKDSGIEWLGEIPEHWEVKRFKFLLSEPFKYGANEAAEINDPNLPRYIRITDVKDDGSLREDTFRSLPENIAKDYLLEEGDILLARSGATVGKTFIYSKSWGKAAYAGYLIRARVSGQNSSDFIYKFLQSKLYFDWVKSIFIQATIQNISAEKYSNLFITTPPLPEQQAIANFLDHKTKQIDQQKLKIQQAIDRLKEYRTALITNAVTGKIDVRQVSIP